jgi:uncharacterized short protein YbdD (DUF466 family)
MLQIQYTKLTNTICRAVQKAGKMSAQEKQYYTSASKTERVRCRVKDCTEPMVAYQNYERHLKRNHPEENYKDKRIFGQKPFSFNLAKEKAGPEEAKGKKAGTKEASAEEAGMENIYKHGLFMHTGEGH